MDMLSNNPAGKVERLLGPPKVWAEEPSPGHRTTFKVVSELLDLGLLRKDVEGREPFCSLDHRVDVDDLDQAAKHFGTAGAAADWPTLTSVDTYT